MDPHAPGGALTEWYARDGAALLRELGVCAGDTAFDVGCGDGQYVLPLAQVVGPQGHVTAVDRNAQKLTALRARLESAGLAERVNLVSGDALDVLAAAAADRFDAALVFDVLQHVDDGDALLAALARVLRPAGQLLVYPTEAVHPGRVPMDRLREALQRHGFARPQPHRARIAHSGGLVDDTVYRVGRA